MISCSCSPRRDRNKTLWQLTNKENNNEPDLIGILGICGMVRHALSRLVAISAPAAPTRSVPFRESRDRQDNQHAWRCRRRCCLFASFPHRRNAKQFERFPNRDRCFSRSNFPQRVVLTQRWFAANPRFKKPAERLSGCVPLRGASLWVSFVRPKFRERSTQPTQ